MANTYTRLLYHCVWSTKNRSPLIAPSIERRLWAYLASIAKDNHIHPLRIGGIGDHIHVLIDLPKTLCISKAMKLLKGTSSSWINGNNLTLSHFTWQDGYAAFTVSPSKISAVTGYIAIQREHHRHQTFEEEYRMFLKHH